MKKAFRIAGVGLAFVAVIAVLVWAVNDTEDDLCRKVNIETDGEFLTVSEIQSWLRRKSLYPLGMPMHSVSTQEIEDGLSKHEMVRNAQCYKLGDTIVEISVEQRKPILRVLTDGETYYVDADRKRMPVRPETKADVIWVRGHIGEQMAREEIAGFVEWLNDNSYWQPRIRSIEVREGKQVLLRQAENEPVILLGRLEDYEKKLHKVRVFIEEANVSGIDVSSYKQLDARFDGQIVGRN